MTMTSVLTVANTIAAQIGDRAFFMMGTRKKLGTASSLIFDIRGSVRGNKIVVTLDVMDTYTVELFKVRGVESKLIDTKESVYCDMLHAIIEEMTGLALSL